MFKDSRPIYSMDDEELFGQQFSSSISFLQSVEFGCIVPLRMHLLDVASEDLVDEIEDSEVLMLTTSDGNSVELDTEGKKYLAVASLAAREYLQMLVEKEEAKKVLVFFGRTIDCSRAIDKSHPLSLVKNDIHDFQTYEYHSGISQAKRQHIREEFSKNQHPSMLTSVRAIREGVSVNDVDTVVLMRGYGSSSDDGLSVDLVQHVGRAVRNSKGKTYANVIVPIPSVGFSVELRRRIVGMISLLMEEVGILGELASVMGNNSGRLSVGTLRNFGIEISPHTTITEQQVVESLESIVVEYAKENDIYAFRQISDFDFERRLQDILEMEL